MTGYFIAGFIFGLGIGILLTRVVYVRLLNEALGIIKEQRGLIEKGITMTRKAINRIDELESQDKAEI